jgi:hypothetical protein
VLYNPLTMPHFIDWLDRHPRYKSYRYGDWENCLCAQYYKEFNSDYIPPGLIMLDDCLFSDCPFVVQAEWVAYGGKDGLGECTFGAASDRARLAYTPAESVI